MLFLKEIFFRSLLYLCLHDKMLKINKTKTWKAEISHLFIDIQLYQLYICIEQEKHNRLNIILIIVILNFQVTYVLTKIIFKKFFSIKHFMILIQYTHTLIDINVLYSLFPEPLYIRWPPWDELFPGLWRCHPSGRSLLFDVLNHVDGLGKMIVDN